MPFAPDFEATQRLADALLARAVPTSRALPGSTSSRSAAARAPGRPAWRRPRRAGVLARRRPARRPDLPRHRGQAFRAAQALTRQLPAGPWVRLYSFSSMAVLNAQLQTALSVGEYATVSGDPNRRAPRRPAEVGGRGDAALVRHRRLVAVRARRRARRRSLPHVRRVAARAARPARRPLMSGPTTPTLFDAYVPEPPERDAVSAVKVVYPLPKDGFRDRATVTFDLSKAATVRLAVAGERRPMYLSAGAGTRSAGIPARAARSLRGEAGRHGPRQHGRGAGRPDRGAPRRDAAGRHRRARRRTALLGGDRRGDAVAAPRLRFANGAGTSRSTSASAADGNTTVAVPKGRWGVTLLAADSSGNGHRARSARVTP